MRYFIYLAIGVGISVSNPYRHLSQPRQILLSLMWPVIIVRDTINALDKQAKEERGTSDRGDANHG